MKIRNRVGMLVVAGVAVAAAGTMLAQDWPQWRGANRDGKADFKPPKTWPKELPAAWQTWKVTVGSGDATPALVGDKLYVFSRQEGNEVTRCLNAMTGKEIWVDKYEVETITGPDAAVHGGPRSSPTVADGRIFTLGVRGMVSCLDAASGKKLWRKNDFPGAWPRFHTSMSPLVADGMCILQLGSESDGAIVAYDVGSGEPKWKWTGEGAAYASPVLLTVGGTQMIVALTSKSIVGIAAADGKLLWQAAFVPQGRAYNAATPIVDGQTVIYCGQGRGTRAVKIEKQGDAFSAKELWSNPDVSVQFNSPVLKNGLIFGLSDKGNFFCMNAQTGKTAWTDPAGGRGGFGSVVDGGSLLIGLTAKGQLTAFQPSEKEYKEDAALKAADQVYAYPVVTGNRIYVKDQDAVTLWTVE